MEIIGEARNGTEAQRLCQELSPDILLLDLSMSGPNPVETVRVVKNHCPTVKIIILTAYDDEIYIRGLIKLGIAGYILKDEAPEALVCAVQTAMAGGTWFSQRVINILMAPQQSDNFIDKSVLSDREQDVLLLISKGLSNSQIAENLALADGTVKNHIVSIYQKLNIHTRAEAVIRGLEFMKKS